MLSVLTAPPQGIKHTRRAMRAQGLDPGSVSQPGTPASCASPLAGSRSASPSRAPRGRHSRHGSADWGSVAGGGAPAVEPAPESLICSVCGIMATSAVNLEVRAWALHQAHWRPRVPGARASEGHPWKRGNSCQGSTGRSRRGMQR